MIPFNCPAVHHEHFRNIRWSTIFSFRCSGGSRTKNLHFRFPAESKIVRSPTVFNTSYFCRGPHSYQSKIAGGDIPVAKNWRPCARNRGPWFPCLRKIGDRAFVVLALAAFLRRFQFSTFRRFLSMVDATTAPAMRFCGAYEVAVIIISVNITVTSWDV